MSANAIVARLGLDQSEFQNGLKQAVQNAKTSQAEVRRAQAQAENGRRESLEQARLLAIAQGQDKIAAAIERTLALRAEAVKLVRTLGVSEQEGLAMARKRLDLEDAIARKKAAQAAVRPPPLPNSVVAGSSMSEAALGKAAGLVAGALSLDALKNEIQETIDFGSAIADMSDQVQLSTTDFQQWVYALGLSGSKQEETTKGLQKFAENITSAREGNDKLVQTFEKVGVSWEDLNNLSTDQLLMRVATGLRDMDDPAASVAVSLDLMGKNGAKMAVGLRAGADELARIRGQAQILKPEDIKALDEYGDAIDRFSNGWKVAKAEVLVGSLPDWMVQLNGMLGPAGSLVNAPTLLRNIFNKGGDESGNGTGAGASAATGGGKAQIASPAEARQIRETEDEQKRQFEEINSWREQEAQQNREFYGEKARLEEEDARRKLENSEAEQKRQFEEFDSWREQEAEQKRQFSAFQEEKEKAATKRKAERQQEIIDDREAAADNALDARKRRVDDILDPNAARSRRRTQRRYDRLMDRAGREEELKNRKGMSKADFEREKRLEAERKPPAADPKPQIDKALADGDAAYANMKAAFDESVTGKAMQQLAQRIGKNW